MLIEFSVGNFRSIASKQTLSMVASNLRQEQDSACFLLSDSEYLKKYKLLNSAVIYGANASGKSNLLTGLQTMGTIVITSATSGQRGSSLPIVNFKLDESLFDSVTEFEVIFISNGVRYQYGFSATSSKVYEEWLFAFPKGKAQNWFHREWNEKLSQYDWSFSSSFLGEKQLWKSATRENSLFLSTAVQLNNEQLIPVFDWFSSNISFIGVGGFPTDFTANFCKEGKKESVIKFLQKADINIDDIEIEQKNISIEGIPEFLKDMVLKSGQESMIETKIKTLHSTKQGSKVYFDLGEESTGTQKLFSFASLWLSVLEKGTILVVDELHDNLHPKLVKYLVTLFHNKKTNPKNAQLIFTTHETSILNQEVFRRDQIWFCEKDNQQGTQLIPLTDFKPRKGREDLETSYLSGRYGAVPYIKEI